MGQEGKAAGSQTKNNACQSGKNKQIPPKAAENVPPVYFAGRYFAAIFVICLLYTHEKPQYIHLS